MKNLYLILFMICQSLLVFAQDRSDTLTREDRLVLDQAYWSSPGYYFSRATRFIKSGSDVQASEAIGKLNPYYWLFEFRDTAQLNAYFNEYNASDAIREQIARIYDSIWTVPKSLAYSTFEQMANEDKRLRKSYERCGDTLSCRKISQLMRKADSTHFVFLHDYVSANGWPAIEDGALLALIIAIHDHANHNFYMPHLKKAARKGTAVGSALYLINNHLLNNKSHEEIKEDIATHSHVRFDISELLESRLPASLPRIQKAFKESCGQVIRYYYIVEVRDRKTGYPWFKVNVEKKEMIQQMQRAIQPSCIAHMKYPEVWHVSYFLAETRKMFMVLVYD